MAVPGFIKFTLPLLEIISDGKDYSRDDVVDVLASRLKLSEDQKSEVLSSGVTRFEHRIDWARTYLKKAGLLESTGRGRFRVTQRGLEILKNKPVEINLNFLRQFPEFAEFLNSSRQNNRQEEQEDEVIEPNQTPDEILLSSYQSLRQDLATELLERIKKCSPRFFERLVVDLLVAMGYGGSRKDAGQAIGQSRDGGIDGIIKEDKLGLDAVYIQAKRWDSTVGRPIVQAFAGSLEGQRARKGVLITTSQFSQDAREYVSIIEKKIVLIDGEELSQLMIDHNIGVNEVASYTVKKMDLDYFDE
jgi:restriction system protein